MAQLLRPGPALVALGVALWGTVGIAARLLDALPGDAPGPLAVGCWRLGLAAALLAVPAAAGLLGRGLGSARADPGAVLLVGAAMAGYQACFFTAVPLIGVATATLIGLGGGTLLLVLASVLLLGERLDRLTGTALALGLPGVTLVAGFPTLPAAPGATIGAGLAAAAGGAVCYAGFVLASRRAARRVASQSIVVFGFGAGALLLLPAALADAAPLPASAAAGGLLAFIGLVPTALAYFLYFKGVGATPALVTGLLSLLEPLTATALAWAVLGEALSPPALAGALLLLAALALTMARVGRTAEPAPPS